MRPVALALALFAGPGTALAEPWSAGLSGAGRLVHAFPLPDHGMLVAGMATTPDGAPRAALVRLDGAREVAWALRLDGVRAWTLEHDDGGATCFVDEEARVAGRIDADGRVAWASAFSHPLTGAAPLADGGCVVRGTSPSGPWIARLDSMGALAWSRRWTGADPHDPVGPAGPCLTGAVGLASGRLAIGVAHEGCPPDARVEILGGDGTSLQVASVGSGDCLTRTASLVLAPGGTLIATSIERRDLARFEGCVIAARLWAVEPGGTWGLQAVGTPDPSQARCIYWGSLALFAHGHRIVSLQEAPVEPTLFEGLVHAGHDEAGARTWMALAGAPVHAVASDGAPVFLSGGTVFSHDALVDPGIACARPLVPTPYAQDLQARPWPEDLDDDWVREASDVTVTPAVADVIPANVAIVPPCDPEEPSALDLFPGAAPLRVSRAAGRLALAWEDAGMPEYAIVEGAIGSWSSGEHAACGLVAPSASLAERAGDRWFVATSIRDGAESSLGRTSFGDERAAAADGCP